MSREIRIEGDRVVLRPFRPDEVDTWLAGSLAIADTFPAGPPTREALQAKLRSSSVGGDVDLAIEVDGRVIGDIQTQHPPGEALAPSVFQIGVAIFDAADRGGGLGRDAVSAFIDWLFETRGAVRVQAGTEPGNAAMRAVFERLGFAEVESVLVAGRRHLLYAIGRETWEERRG